MKSVPLIKDARGFYWIPELAGRGILALFTDRRGDYALPRVPARMRLCRSLGIPAANLVGMGQVHGAAVAVIKQQAPGRRRNVPLVVPEKDAAITGLNRRALTVVTADCLPVILVDQQRAAVGIAHAGWRGLSDGVLANTVSAMRRVLGCKPSGLEAFIGPGIRACCYQVGAQLRQYFQSGMRQRKGDWYLDLVAVAARQLARAGVPQAQVFDTQRCTACDPEFFSYRRGDRRARMLSLVMRQE